MTRFKELITFVCYQQCESHKTTQFQIVCSFMWNVCWPRVKSSGYRTILPIAGFSGGGGGGGEATEFKLNLC